MNQSKNYNGFSALLNKNKSEAYEPLPPLQKPIHHSSSYSIPNYNLILNTNIRNDPNIEYEMNVTTSLRSKYKKIFNNNNIMKDYDSCDV